MRRSLPKRLVFVHECGTHTFFGAALLSNGYAPRDERLSLSEGATHPGREHDVDLESITI